MFFAGHIYTSAENVRENVQDQSARLIFQDGAITRSLPGMPNMPELAGTDDKARNDIGSRCRNAVAGVEMTVCRKI
jgi:hypothetical protein